MKFNIFKRKEKEVITESDNKQSNDIVEDFGSFMTKKALISNIETKKPTISSFESNFTEEINNRESFENNYSQVEQNTNLNQTFNESYSEGTIENPTYVNENTNYENQVEIEQENISSFNPYLNIIETYSDLKENETLKPEEPLNDGLSINNINNINNTNEITNIEKNINNSQDVNEVLTNIYKKNNSNQIIPDENKNETIQEPTPSMPVYTNPYKNSVTDPGYKICPKCGQKIREDYKQCFVCGTII